jgi:hypothetical protein
VRHQVGQRFFLVGCATVLFVAALVGFTSGSASAKKPVERSQTQAQTSDKSDSKQKLPGDRLKYIKQIENCVLKYWDEVEAKGEIPESFKKDLVSPVVRIEVFQDLVIQAWIKVSSGSSGVDNLAVLCAKKFKPVDFPKSKNGKSVVALIRFPILRKSAGVSDRSMKPSKLSAPAPISREELLEVHRDRREFDEKSLDVKRARFNNKELKPWEELTPYGCDILNSRYSHR